MISIDSVIKVTETVCECSNSSASGFFDFAMDIALLVVGAVLSHVAVWLAARGKLKVYYSNYIDNVYKRGACFLKGVAVPPHTDFILPLQMDFVNTSGRKHVFRAISAVAYYRGKKVTTLNYSTRGRRVYSDVETNNDEYTLYGVPQQSYSFTIPEHECIHTELFFSYQVYDTKLKENSFDEIRLEWRDTKDKAHSVSILKITECWKLGDVDLPFDWTELQ